MTSSTKASKATSPRRLSNASTARADARCPAAARVLRWPRRAKGAQRNAFIIPFPRGSALAVNDTQTRPDDLALEEMARLLQSLWQPMRLLADLKFVWPELTDKQRNDIRESATYKNKFHESRVKEIIAKITRLAHELKESRNRKLRREILTFLRYWDKQEPDRAKVLASAITHRRKN